MLLQVKYNRTILVLFLSTIGTMIGGYIWLPWGIDNALVSLVFMEMGYLLHINDIEKLVKEKHIYLLSFPCFLIGIFYFCIMDIEFAIAPRYYTHLIFTVIASIFMIVPMIYISKSLSNTCFSKILSWLGKNSMILFCVHGIERATVIGYDIKYSNTGIKIISKLLFDILLMYIVTQMADKISYSCIFESIKKKGIYLVKQLLPK